MQTRVDSLGENLGFKPLLANRGDHPVALDPLRIVRELQPIPIQIDFHTLDTGQPFQGCCNGVGSLQSVQPEPVDHAFDVQCDLVGLGRWPRRLSGGRSLRSTTDEQRRDTQPRGRSQPTHHSVTVAEPGCQCCMGATSFREKSQ